MPAPTFIASYQPALTNNGYSTATTPKTVSVTTLAGDYIVVYGGQANGGSVNVINTPSGNGITFTQRQSVHFDGTYSDAAIWTGVDNTGGTNWTLTVTCTSGANWSFACLVFRNATGIGASAQARTTGAPSLALTTTQDNSAIVVFDADWDTGGGSSIVWRTVNGITPTSGNGLQRTYYFTSNDWGAYGAYYSDAGSVGTVTVGHTTPSQKYSIVAVEVLGTVAVATPTPLMWFTGIPN